MYQRRLTRLLLLPSLSSGTTVACVVLAVLGYNAWTYISNQQLFYDNLFGAYGLKTYVWQHSIEATSWGNTFLGSSIAYYILVGAAATVGGLTVYTFLQSLSLLFAGGRHIWSELTVLGSTRRAIVRELVARLVLRTISLIGWGVYTAFFFSTLLPFVIVLNQTGVDTVSAGQMLGWLYCVGAVLLLGIALHMQVVFMRLLLLRPRLFGDRAIEEAEAG
jgi:hypothetical protein